ncbi:hypothetical protein STEG23_031974, partial [Scotinomys teguina]
PHMSVALLLSIQCSKEPVGIGGEVLAEEMDPVPVLRSSMPTPMATTTLRQPSLRLRRSTPHTFAPMKPSLQPGSVGR